MSLNIYTSNRMENLVGALSGVLTEPLASPFSSELVVVQSKGMQRWLAMELARRFGVWANCSYPFPNDMVWRLFRIVLPETPENSAFSPDVMTWRIIGILPSLLEQKEFEQLRHYLAGDREGVKLFQLAGKIADTMDQYTLFRPEMLLEWEAGKGEDWQAVLWRKLAKYGIGKHRGRLKDEFCRQLDDGAHAGGGFPERISVFGISYLPKYHMEVLAATAQATDVNLFLLSPTKEYWADIASPREKARMTPEQRDLRIEGNPLLASLGKLGRDFSDMVIEIGDVAASQDDFYVDPGAATLLKAIQSDILNLAGAEPEMNPRVIDPNDHTIQIHSCHNPMREIEVLHDNLLSLIQGAGSLAPRNIVVMTPDIETYAPYIATIFDGCQDPARKIPYSIADRRLTNESQIATAFLKLLDLSHSRLAVPQVLDLFEAPPVARRFNLELGELEIIRSWVEETRIRWGMNEEDRLRLGLPGYRENSWQAGVDRLLLGYAMPVEAGRLFNGALPYDDMEGSDSQTLGKFLDFVRRIAGITDALSRPETLAGWRELLRTVLDDFMVADDDSARELAAVVEVVDNLAELEAQAGFTEKIEFSVIHSWLSTRLAKEEKGVGFMTGGVTFCAMLPMRSIPFRVVALIGMNDGAFPRQSRPPGFDLIAQHPHRGDRSLRDEDRYLFLESVLSARDCLYISHVGQSIKDNSEVPPSVLVSEFLDAIARGFTIDEKKVKERFITKHRLQAFSRDYFTDDSQLFSYSAENCAALLEKRGNPWVDVEFLSSPLAPPSDEWKDVSLTKLLRFFANPAKFLLENRLGIRLEHAAEPLEEREPFAVVGLEAYNLKQEILEIILRGEDAAELYPIARCRGILPPALHGEAVFADAVSEVTGFAEKLNERLAGKQPLEPLDFELELDGLRLTGRLDRIWPDQMIRYRCAKMKAKDQISAWIEHLVLNEIKREAYPRQTLLMMVGGSKTFRQVDDAAAILKTILDCYWQGLSEPLRFFPASAMEYANKQEWRLDKAGKRWAAGYNYPGEGDDPYYRICFGHEDPFNAEFERLARALLAPMMQHLE